jgi:hypothetical protein
LVSTVSTDVGSIMEKPRIPIRYLGRLAGTSFETVQAPLDILRPLSATLIDSPDFDRMMNETFGDGPCQYCPVTARPCKTCVRRVLEDLRDRRPDL